MINKPLFSYCLCTYNDKFYLSLLLDSLQRNCQIPFEVCIHVNNSVDGTIEFLEGKKEEEFWADRLKTTVGKRNMGIAGVNHAVGVSSGKYIGWLNADHVLLREFEVNLYKYLKAEENNIYTCNVIEPHNQNYKYITAPDEIGDCPENFDIAALERFYQREVIGKTGKNIVSINHPLFCAKELWDKIGGPSPRYFSWTGDIDFSHRAYNLGAKQIMIKSSVVFHFVSATLKRKDFDIDRKKLAKEGEELFQKQFGIYPEGWKLIIGDGKEVNA